MATTGRTVQIPVTGAFSLAEAAEFGFGQRDAASYDGVMRLAFCLDGYRQQVGVAVRQDAPDTLTCEITGAGDPRAVTAQVARMLSVDIDARGYDALGRADPLVGELQAARPGMRPPLFYSVYEAATWAVLSARRPHRQMAQVRDRLSREHGRVLRVAGADLAAMPTPKQLLDVGDIPGLTAVKVQRLHAIAEAALAGALDTAVLRAVPAEEAAAAMRKLPGIGPFYAELITVRTLGHTDLLPTDEPRVRAIAAELTGSAEPLSQQEFETMAQAWAPWRTWVTVAVRAAGPVALRAADRR